MQREKDLWSATTAGWPQPSFDLNGDTIRWKLTTDGTFTVKSIKDCIRPPSPQNYLSKFVGNLWSSLIPKKCKFFLWSILHNGINTMDKYQKRNPSLYLNPNWCVLCRNSSESAEHIFMTCSFSSVFWDQLQQEGITLHTQTIQASLDFIFRQTTTNKPQILNSNLIAATLWSIWLELNRTFQGSCENQNYLWADILSLAAL